MHVKPGKIEKVEGIEEIESCSELVSIVPVHHVGDNIEEWGSSTASICIYTFITDTKIKQKNSLIE